VANEITTTSSFTYTKNGITATDGRAGVLTSVAGNGLNANPSFSVATTAGGVVIPLGNVTSPGGWFWIINLDPTNYVLVLTATSGTEFSRLLPGDPPLWMRMAPGITAVAVQAHTSACIVSYKVFDL
jgi:hypothetical protein